MCLLQEGGKTVCEYAGEKRAEISDQWLVIREAGEIKIKITIRRRCGQLRESMTVRQAT